MKMTDWNTGYRTMRCAIQLKHVQLLRHTRWSLCCQNYIWDGRLRRERTLLIILSAHRWLCVPSKMTSKSFMLVALGTLPYQSPKNPKSQSIPYFLVLWMYHKLLLANPRHRSYSFYLLHESCWRTLLRRQTRTEGFFGIYSMTFKLQSQSSTKL